MTRAYAHSHTAALRPYIVRRRGRAFRLLVRLARRAPWWSLSLALHVAALVVLWRVPYRVEPDEGATAAIAVELTDGERFVEFIDPIEPLPEAPADEEVVADPDPPVPVIEVSLGGMEPAIEPLPVAVGPVVEWEAGPRVEAPSATPVLTVELPASRAAELYGPRSPRGRTRAIGGRGGTSRRAEAAVRAGLRWLATAQEVDGSWSCRRWGGGGDYDVGMTGLALLAFHGAGYTQDKGPFKPQIRRALAWLRASQKPGGQFPWRTFYEQGIAAMAVAEAYAMGRSPRVGRMAQRAIDYVCRVQPDHGGFRYGGAVPRAQGDTSVTGWQIMAIESALSGGLDVPAEAIGRCQVFLRSTYRDAGATAYLVANPDGAPATTAVGMLCRLFLGGGGDDEIRAAAHYLLEHEKRDGGPGKGRNRLVGDLYYTYYATTAMFQMGGEHWAVWNRLFREPLVAAQVQTWRDARGRYLHGSWDPANHAWGRRGGRVYTTAMALLSLEAYYRFLPLYKR